MLHSPAAPSPPASGLSRGSEGVPSSPVSLASCYGSFPPAVLGKGATLSHTSHLRLVPRVFPLGERGWVLTDNLAGSPVNFSLICSAKELNVSPLGLGAYGANFFPTRRGGHGSCLPACGEKENLTSGLG